MVSVEKLRWPGRSWKVFAFLLLAVTVAGCESGKKEAPSGLRLAPVSFSDLPGWQEDDLQEALPALQRSCSKLASLPDERPVGPEGIGGTAAAWRAPCARVDAAARGEGESLRRVLEEEFRPFAVSDGAESEGLFTGYFEAELQGSLDRAPGYDVPIHARPDDLVEVSLSEFGEGLPDQRLVGRVEDGRLQPYPERAIIENGHLDGQDAVLLWADDPVDAFFLHVQGSGVVELNDGRRVRVGYAGSNGRQFYAIGRALIDEGIIDREKSSMQAIRDWLRANPDRARELMHRNERYIFFRMIEGEGPIGAQGVPLTPGRSLAVDLTQLPLGAPIWLDTTWPATNDPLQRLMVAQDTGNAIRGVVRGDFFWGSGEAALEQAGRMRQQGRYWLLLPEAVVSGQSTDPQGT